MLSSWKTTRLGLAILLSTALHAQTSGYPDITDINTNVGIRTSNPAFPFDISGYLHVSGDVNPNTNVQGAYLGWNALTGSTGETDLINNRGGGSGGFAFMNTPNSGSPRQTLMFLDGNGNLTLSGTVNSFYIPALGNPGSWVKLGTFTGTQDGRAIRITAVINNGYNANNGQDATYVISFKTSNGGNVDSNGFAGNSSYYAIGSNAAIPPGNIKWVANAPGVNATSYDLYINIPVYPGGSHYTVTVGQNSTWTNSGTLVGGDPGPPSNTILAPAAEFDLPYGNMGIGTGAPGAKLEVNGNIKLTSGSGASITFPDNTIQSTAWNGTLYGGDYAESVDVAGDLTTFQPGDILVIDPDHDGKFLKSSEPYSKLVSGIYSTHPGIRGRRQTSDRTQMDQEVPMAMVGIVPTKVSAENGPIRRGDLLVTSATPGYAMKGTDSNLLTGAIMGKALGGLSDGTGVIEVLVTLQ